MTKTLWQHKFIVLLFLIFLPYISYAEDMEVSEKEIPQKTRINLTSGYSVISRSSGGTNLNSIHLVGGFQYALVKKIGLMGGIKQGISMNGFSNLYTEFEVGGVYAITGSLFKNSKVTNIDGKDVASSSGYYEGGFRVELGIAQYNFSGRASSVPYSGFSAGLSYDFQSSSSVICGVSLREDMLTNNTSSIQSMQMSIRFGFFLD